MSINTTEKINPQYSKLDLMYDEQFYEQLDPVIITLKNPVIFPELKVKTNKGDISIPENTMKEFIIRRKDLNKIIDKKHSTISFQKDNCSKVLEIPFSDFQYNLENNPKEKVFEILKNQPVEKQIGIFKATNSNSNYFLDIATNISYHKFFIPIAITALLKRDMNPNTFLEHFKGTDFNTATIIGWLSRPEDFHNMKNKLGDDFIKLIENSTEKIIENYGDLYPARTLNEYTPLSEEWQKSWDFAKKVHIFTLITNPEINIDKDSVCNILAIALTTRFTQKNSKLDNITLEHLNNFDGKTIKQISKIIDTLENGKKTNKKIKEQLSEFSQTLSSQKTSIEYEETQNSVIFNIPWKSITVNKFSEISSEIKNADYLQEFVSYYKENLKSHYQEKDYPVLHMLFNYFINVRKSIDTWLGCDPDETEWAADRAVYIQDNNLYLRTSKHCGVIDKDTLKNIYSITLEKLSTQTISNFSEVNSKIGNILLSKHLDKKTSSDGEEISQDNSFKL